MRIAAAYLSAGKTIKDFSFDHILGAARDLIAHLATTMFVAECDNVVLLGPPMTVSIRRRRGHPIGPLGAGDLAGGDRWLLPGVLSGFMVACSRMLWLPVSTPMLLRPTRSMIASGEPPDLSRWCQCFFANRGQNTVERWPIDARIVRASCPTSWRRHDPCS